ncbi:acetyltransferase [Rhabdobacter roseus]|uniref:KDO2-lipid IV(A) lauroyltransferase n=1 Tax=Rhabdobacter roseus TaxID=1655419 RepID=A0A840U1Z5_9BACT|nr:lipid A biosynthesis acyltransferase [Rhabdobacter roseus]MBB5285859.1 KDO2-lipid IV(A) lauroyltransferase [Rhabdobacter roseus]
MNQWASRLGTWLLDALSRRSWKFLYFLSDGLCWLVFGLIKYRQGIVRENLKKSFPEKNDEQRLSIARQYYRHFADLILETIKLRTAPATCVRERIRGDISVVHELFDQGKSAIFVMGHRGNWELANLFSSLCFKHDTIVVYRPLANRAFDSWFLGLRTRFGARLVPMDDLLTELSKPSKKPYAVVLANDQSPFPEKAYWTHFLNQDTGVFRGVEAIARHKDLTVLYADFKKIETERGFYQVTITTITNHPKAMPQNGILEKQIRLLENDIQHQPANWLWSHRRWKHTKPARLRPGQLLGTE